MWYKKLCDGKEWQAKIFYVILDCWTKYTLKKNGTSAKVCKQETLGPIDCAFQSFKKKRICNRFHRQLKRSSKVKEDGTQVARDIWTRTFDPWLKIVWSLKAFKLQSKGGNERTFPNIGVEQILIF
jgi:hypothetical protein